MKLLSRVEALEQSQSRECLTPRVLRFLSRGTSSSDVVAYTDGSGWQCGREADELPEAHKARAIALAAGRGVRVVFERR
jgi:hypothetical protein